MGRRILAFVIPAVTASFAMSCQIFFDRFSAEGGSDASTDAPPPRCDPSKPFGTPVLVPGIPPTNLSVSGARLTPDELTIYYLRTDTGGNSQLFVATRAKTSDAFGPSVEVVSVDSTLASVGKMVDVPSPSSDDLTLFTGAYTVVDGGGVTYPASLWVTHRQQRSESYDDPKVVPFAQQPDGGFGFSDPIVSPGGDKLYAMLWRDSPEGSERRVAGTPVAAPIVNGNVGPFAPLPKFAGLEYPIVGGAIVPGGSGMLYYSVEVSPPYAATVRSSIWRARPNGNGHYDYGPLVELQGMLSRVPTWVSSDDCHLYFDEGLTTSAKVFTLRVTTRESSQ